LAVLGAIAFEAILPLSWAIVRGRALSLSPPFIVVVVLLTTSLLAYVIAEPVRIRRHQWRTMLWYPSTWLAIPLACGIAALTESRGLDNARQQPKQRRLPAAARTDEQHAAARLDPQHRDPEDVSAGWIPKAKISTFDGGPIHATLR
jgi:hypothetical protein